ncbi:MAG: PH domain-containing protein [Candidatus Moraniibacteriota bacterium]|nr:MAG: PH domain-containing protein [Candidatus Moranbacteria bacterium]
MVGSYHFKGQEDGEEIIRVIRRHWFDITMQFLPIIGAILALSVLFPILSSTLILDIQASVYWFFASFLGICFWLVASIIWIDYYLDVWIMTNRRVVNVTQKGLFFRHVSDLRYNKIQDITTEVTGLIPTFLNYGDVFIQTAGTEPRFIFHNVGNPYLIKDELVALQKRMRRGDITEMKRLLHDDGTADI